MRFAEVLQLVGGFRAGAPLGVQEVDIIDEDQLGAQFTPCRIRRW